MQHGRCSSTCQDIGVHGHSSYRPMQHCSTLTAPCKMRSLLLDDLQLMDSGNIPLTQSPLPSIKHWFQKDSSITALNSQAYGKVTSLERFLASSLLSNFSSCHLSLILSSCALTYIGSLECSLMKHMFKSSKVVVSLSLRFPKITDESLITLFTTFLSLKKKGDISTLFPSPPQGVGWRSMNGKVLLANSTGR